MTFVQLGSELRMEESLRVHEGDKTKGKLPVNRQPSVPNKNNNRNNGNGISRKNDDRNKPNKKPKELVCWRCGKNGHAKRDCRVDLNKNGAGNSGGGNNNVAPNNG